ncbi:MAG: DUF1772 domain-containing protein [Gammaproteobacteria bacterium]|nr:DUF1772 domain-containing protein [Gammaproteobacteria bacterium]
MGSLNELVFALTLVAALGCGIVAGVFFAFSTFVMKALGRVPPEAGIGFMQSINVTVLTPWFMGVFFGTGIACIVALTHSLYHWGETGTLLRFAGSALYLAGSILVTIVFNVPRNERLAAVSPADPSSEEVWGSYVSSWTAWNHVRTAASFAAAALFGMALGS